MDPEGSQKNIAVADREPLLGPGHTLATVTDKISTIVLTPGITKGWLGGFTIAVMLFLLLNVVMTYLFTFGVGIWGINIPIAWCFCHHQLRLVDRNRPRRDADFRLPAADAPAWRTSINRFAEAMTIFAVMCAGMFPLLHMGRPWLFFYLMPYPNPMWLWPQFRSPLVWDVFAVSTYFTVSLLFWFVGLIPDLATLRDRAKSRAIARSSTGCSGYGLARIGRALVTV